MESDQERPIVPIQESIRQLDRTLGRLISANDFADHILYILRKDETTEPEGRPQQELPRGIIPALNWVTDQITVESTTMRKRLEEILRLVLKEKAVIKK